VRTVRMAQRIPERLTHPADAAETPGEVSAGGS